MPAAVCELSGRFERLIWEADGRSAIVARIVDADGEQRTIKGSPEMGPGLQIGLHYRFWGQWEEHAKHGPQFAFGTFAAIEPHDQKGIVAYLVALCDGIGERRAAKLWEAFGGSAVEVLREEPQRVAAAGIMNLEAAREASQTLHNEGAFESVKIDLLTLLAGRGFHLSRLIPECLRRWGGKAPALLRRNPYLLLLKKLPSAGFKRCDRLYLDLGLPATRRKRQTLCVWHALASDSTGHTWFDGQRVVRELLEAIPGCEPKPALRLGIRAGLLSKHRDAKGHVWLSERQKAHQERVVARKVKDLLAEDALRKGREDGERRSEIGDQRS